MVTTNDIVCYPLQLTYENKYTPTRGKRKSDKETSAKHEFLYRIFFTSQGL